MQNMQRKEVKFVIILLLEVLCMCRQGRRRYRDDDNMAEYKYLMCFGLYYCCLRIAIRLSFTSVEWREKFICTCRSVKIKIVLVFLGMLAALDNNLVESL